MRLTVVPCILIFFERCRRCQCENMRLLLKRQIPGLEETGSTGVEIMLTGALEVVLLTGGVLPPDDDEKLEDGACASAAPARRNFSALT